MDRRELLKGLVRSTFGSALAAQEARALIGGRRALLGGASIPAWVPSAGGVRASYYVDYVSGRYWALGTSYPTHAAWLAAVTGSFTRASTAWDTAGNSYATNAARIDNVNGLTTEEARTNYLANPNSPATQTQSLGAGNYTLLVTGSGSCTLSGGPTGTATAGAPISFNLAGTTSVTFTPAGSLTYFNCQNQSYQTTPILAAAASTIRQGDVELFTPANLPSGGYSLVIQGMTPAGVDTANGNSNQVLFDFLGVSNFAVIVRDRFSSALLLSVNDGTTTNASTNFGLQNNVPVKAAMRVQANNHELVVNGDSASTHIAKITTRGLPSVLTGRVGRGNGVQGWNSTIANFAVYYTPLSENDLIIQSTMTGAIAAWGDSLVAGSGASSSTTNWPAVLGTDFATWRTVYNGGIGGQTSTQIADRVVADTIYTSRIQIYEGGINNYQGDTVPGTVTNDFARMVASNKSGKFFINLLVPGLYTNEAAGQPDRATIDAINSYLAATYPGNVVDQVTPLIAAYNPANPVDVLNFAANTTPLTLHATTAGTIVNAITTNSQQAFTTSSAVSPGYVLLVGSEYIQITAASGTSVTACVRGYAGTTAATYGAGQAATYYDPRHLNDAGYAIWATQNYNFIQSKGW